MPVASTSKRVPPKRPAARAKPQTNSADDLADRLATTLTLSKGNSQNADNKASSQGRKLFNMRAINTASQGLSTIAQTGWTAAVGIRPDKTLREAVALVATARKAIEELRTQSPDDYDVEKAASSISGKLLGLEMHAQALEILQDMQPHLCTLYVSESPDLPARRTPLPRSTGIHADLIALPLPSTQLPQSDLSLLLILSTYLSHTLIAVSYLSLSQADILPTFVNTLHTSPTFVTWAPRFSALPPKHLDALLTRTYTAITKVSTAIPSKLASEILRMRAYALSCLLLTSPSTIQASTFWDQVVKFGISFSKAPHVERKVAAREVVLVCDEMVTCAERREDREAFLRGKSFLAFCEFWLAYAKAAGDMPSLDKVVCIMKRMQSSSAALLLGDGGENKLSEAMATMKLTDGLRPSHADGPGSSRSADISAMRTLYASLTQMAVLLGGLESYEGSEDELGARLSDASSALKQCRTFGEPNSSSDDDYARVHGKMRRAVERLQRATVKIIDVARQKKHVQTVLTEAAHTLEAFLPYQGTNSDDFTSLLDALFVLSRVTLLPSDPTSVDATYSLLSRAATVLNLDLSTVNHRQQRLDRPAVLEEATFANFLRCISGALHTIGGTLYQAGKYGSAIRFLRPGCVIGGLALQVGKAAGSLAAESSSDSDVGTQAEAWKQLDSQLNRRWELLGVCYSKIGDRKLAYGAFIDSVASYPFEQSVVQAIRTVGPRQAFETSPALKQLGTIVDRITYMAACELMQSPQDSSLKRVCNTLNVDVHSKTPEEDCRCIIGALLERQVDCLEGALWKDGVAMAVEALLADILSIYDAGSRPVRRATVVLRALEFAYYAGKDGESTDFGDAEDVEILLTSKTLGLDISLANTVPHLQVAAHLWTALHAHRRQHPDDAIGHVQEACRLLKLLLSPPAEASPAAKKPPPRSATLVRMGKGKAPAVRAGTIARQQVPKTPRKAAVKLRLSKESGLSPKIRRESGESARGLDTWTRLVPLLRTACQVVSLLGQSSLKVQLLRLVRQLCDRAPGYPRDEFIQSCTDLAHEYVKLGKIKKAAGLYNRALASMRSSPISDEVQIMFLLRYTESLAVVGDIDQSEVIYTEALGVSNAMSIEDKALPTSERIRLRAGRLRRAALAARAFAEIQSSKDEPTASVSGLLQSLRLWNRAISTLSRLEAAAASSTKSGSDFPNPFQASSNSSSPSKGGTPAPELAVATVLMQPRASMSGIEWQIAEGLLTTLLCLGQAYFCRGSVREAEYFTQQAEALGISFNAPALVGRALAMKAEINLYLGQLDVGHDSLTAAANALQKVTGPETADLRRLHGEHSQLNQEEADARSHFSEAVNLLEELDKIMAVVDAVGPRRSSLLPGTLSSKGGSDALVPTLLSSLLRHQIWLLRSEPNEEYHALLERLLALPSSAISKAEEHALLGRLALHSVYGRFREDMFLNSLTESVISLPMGMSGDMSAAKSTSSQDILRTLGEAEKLFRASLASLGHSGSVSQVRRSAVSLASIRAFQFSLGRQSPESAVFISNLLDIMGAITLRRELLDVIPNKFPAIQDLDDLRWPALSQDTSIQVPVRKCKVLASPFDSDEEEDPVAGDDGIAAYWESLRKKYHDQTFDFATLTRSKADCLPERWTVINVCVTEDKGSLMISRQRPRKAPLVFCLPLRDRQESDDDEHLTFEDALAELKEIVRLSDEGTKKAVDVKKHDQEARAAWWADRMALDKRLQELLDSIEFCWLGAFKTIFSPPVEVPPTLLADLRSRLDKIFKRSLVTQDKKQKTRMRLEDTLLECLSTLSPKCRDEELEDLVYFILDLYQFHGVQVATAEVDVDQVVVELRTALEEHAAKVKSHVHSAADDHMFLVLDKNVQGIPWESMPMLRGRSVSRIPSMDFLIDRLELAKVAKEKLSESSSPTSPDHDAPVDRAAIDPSSAYYVLNPSGDLSGTERRFAVWAKSMEAVGWDGVVGRVPSEQELSDALSRKDLFIYFGHGGAEQYIRSHKIRHLPRCAATMLWGCSSGLLRDMGDFDRIGTPYNYMLAGCPTLVANLWDVTDRDIDKFSQSVFDKLHLTPEAVRRHAQPSRNSIEKTSIVAAVAESRDVCKLKYLTGAAPVIYGIPFYL